MGYRVELIEVQDFCRVIMARYKARFRISIKDNLTGRALKIELLPYIGDRYLVRQNGLHARAVQHASLTKVFARLRRWMVREVKRSRSQYGQKV